MRTVIFYSLLCNKILFYSLATRYQ